MSANQTRCQICLLMKTAAHHKQRIRKHLPGSPREAGLSREVPWLCFASPRKPLLSGGVATHHQTVRKAPDPQNLDWRRARTCTLKQIRLSREEACVWSSFFTITAEWGNKGHIVFEKTSNQLKNNISNASTLLLSLRDCAANTANLFGQRRNDDARRCFCRRMKTVGYGGCKFFR